MPTVSILSYILSHEIGRIQKSDSIVIHSAPGGIGSMLVQITKLTGVQRFIATADSKDNVIFPRIKQDSFSCA
jgi:NADPH:quinone reductase